MKTLMSAFLFTSLISNAAFAQDSCSERNLRMAKLDLQHAQEMEQVFKENYKDAKRSNNTAATILLTSTAFLSLTGVYSVFAASSIKGYSAFVYGSSMPFISSTLFIKNGAFLGSGVATEIAVKAASIGYSAYELFREDEIYKASKEGIQLSEELINEQLQAVQKRNAKVLDEADYSQLQDGLLLGRLDRKLTLNLYNNSLETTALQKAKVDLLTRGCNNLATLATDESDRGEINKSDDQEVKKTKNTQVSDA